MTTRNHRQGSKQAKASGAEKSGRDWVGKGHPLIDLKIKLIFVRADFTKPLQFPMRKKRLEYKKLFSN